MTERWMTETWLPIFLPRIFLPKGLLVLCSLCFLLFAIPYYVFGLFATGRVNQNVLPWPGSLSTPIWPP